MSRTEISDWLFLRGLGREQAHWGDFLERCGDRLGWRCVALDLPGTGTEQGRRSPASIAAIREDLQARAALLDLKQPIGIVGLSMGGMVALDWAAAAPAQVAGLVLINSSSGASAPLRRLRPAVLATLCKRCLTTDLLKKEQAVLAMISNQHAGDRRLLADWVAVQAQRPVAIGTIINQLWAAATFSLPAVPADIAALLVASRADGMVSWRCSERLAALLNRPLVLHDHAGHDLPLDAPEWVIEQIYRQCCARQHGDLATMAVE